MVTPRCLAPRVRSSYSYTHKTVVDRNIMPCLQQGTKARPLCLLVCVLVCVWCVWEGATWMWSLAPLSSHTRFSVTPAYNTDRERQAETHTVSQLHIREAALQCRDHSHAHSHHTRPSAPQLHRGDSRSWPSFRLTRGEVRLMRWALFLLLYVWPLSSVATL